MSAEPFTLGELLELDAWGLGLLTAEQSALSRTVAGVHSIEIAEPSRWLAPDWVMLTTGVRLRGSPERQRALIAELADGGVAALGFGEGLSFQEVPRALLHEAERRAFPVFSIPIGTPFREIITGVNWRLASNDLRILQRLNSIQRFLIDALQEDDPREALLARLTKVLDMTVFVLGPNGECAEPGMDALTHCLAGMVSVQPRTQELEVDGWAVLATPLLRRSGACRGWLVAASKRRHRFGPINAPVLQAAVAPLLATERLRRVEIEQQRSLRANVLNELLASESPAALVEARAAALGINLAQPADLLAVGLYSSSGDTERWATLMNMIERWLADAELSFLLTVRDEEIVILVQDASERSGELIDVLLREDDQILIGVGRTIEKLENAVQAYRDARQAVRRLRRAGSLCERVLHFEALDLGSLLIAETSEARIRSKLHETLRVLDENPPLRAALVTFFDHGMDVSRAAGALFLHPNSLRYRLRRVERLVDGSLKDPATITSLFVALSAEQRSPSSEPVGPASPPRLAAQSSPM